MENSIKARQRLGCASHTFACGEKVADKDDIHQFKGPLCRI